MSQLFQSGPETKRVPGLNAGQQGLLILLTRLAVNGEWTGSRAELAEALGCSADTVTRRKDKLVALGLISAVPSGRVMTYRVLSSSTRRAGDVSPRIPATAKKRSWWKRPDDNQLEFDFGPATPPTSRREVARRLAATTLEWMSLVVTLVIGPATKRPTTPATFTPKTTTAPTTFALETPESPITTDASAAEPQAPTSEPATPPAAIEPPIPIGISIPPLPESQLSSPTNPIEPTNTGNCRALKFCLWPNAKKEEFGQPQKVQEAFERLLKVGGCTNDERLLFFKAMASINRLAKPTDRVPGLVTSVFRGEGTPWRSRGNAEDERVAREMIRILDVPVEMQRRTADLSIDVERARQAAALRNRYGT